MANEKFSALLRCNEKWVDKFSSSAIMQLIKSEHMEQEAVRERLLSCIQTFSDFFQKTLMLRSTFTRDKHFLSLAQEHLDEEYGHNFSLLRERKGEAAVWDPILNATSCWFSWQMLTLDNIEKLLLVHLVLESSGGVFFCAANKIMQKYKTTNYFAVHSENDERHGMMGSSLLTDLRDEEYDKLSVVQDRGWEMLLAACNHIAVLSLGGK